MLKHLIKTGLIITSVSFAASAAIHVLKPFGNSDLINYVILSAGFISSLYLLFRINALLKSSQKYFRNLLAGNYNTGIAISEAFHDEVYILSNAANKFSEDLRAYDSLRADKTALSHRIMDTIYRNISEPLILADINKNTFKLNPAIQKIFDIKQENFTFDSILKNKDNAAFSSVFYSAVENEKINKTADIRLFLPVRELNMDITVRIYPLKDNSETVRFAIILVSQQT